MSQSDDPVLLAEAEDLEKQLSEDPSGLGYLSPVFPLNSGDDRIGLRFDTGHSSSVEGRVSRDGGDSFGPWQDFRITFQEGPAHNAHLDLSPGATHAQLRFRIPEAKALRHLYVEAFKLEPELKVDLNELDEPGIYQQALVANQPGVVKRSSWGARNVNCSGSHTPNRITVHHTDTPTQDSISAEARVRQIQSFHIDTRKWCDIGYHFLIGQDGRIYQGRVETLIGAHVSGNNTHNLGLSFIGNYHPSKPSSAMLEQASKVLTWASNQYGIALSSNTVKGHRDYGSTTCPGDALYAELGNLVSAATGGPGTTPSTGTVRGVIFWGTNFSNDLNDPSRRIRGATVKLGSGKTTTTDTNGNYVFEDVPPGTVQISASASGYVANSTTATVNAGSTSWGNIMLAKQSSPGGTQIVVNSPASGTVLSSPQAVVKGTWQGTAPSGITVNGWEAGITGNTFQRTIDLRPGSNIVNVVAYGPTGSEVARTVLDLIHEAPEGDPADDGSSSGGCGGVPDVEVDHPWLPKGTGQAAVLLLGTFAAALSGRRWR